MTYRDDREAMFERAAALERELERTKREADAAKVEAERLRAENEELRVTLPETLGLMPIESMATVKVPRKRTPVKMSLLARAATGAGGALIAVGGIFAAADLVTSVFMLTIGIAAMLVSATRGRKAGLPIDRAALQELRLETTHKIVRVMVRFRDPLVASQREPIRQSANRGDFRAEWDDDTFVLRSKKPLDPETMLEFCKTAFAWLERVHAKHPIARITPRAGKWPAAKPRYPGAK